MNRRAAFHNLGCRVNAYETEAMKEQLQSAGYRIVGFDEPADVYVVNTCTVTAVADRKSRQMLHRARELNPASCVVAAGCYVEDAARGLTEDAAVDLLLGNEAKQSLAAILDRYFAGDAEKVYIKPPAEASGRELFVTGTEGRTRAFLKIQDGCNQFCSYCIIPYVRGRVRSRKPEEVIREAERLAAAGFPEIVLTGIHLTSYGADFGRAETGRGPVTGGVRETETNAHLLGVIRRIAALPGIRRVRLGSVDPALMTPDFTGALSGIPEVCPQFHLSLQSGSGSVLAAMNRHYTPEEYEAVCGGIRSCFDDPAITTDIIVGFPGETEDHFRETVDFAERIGFAKIHIFKYSKREGTRAAAMPDQVPEDIKKRRSMVLAAKERELRMRFLKRRIGGVAEVLFEEKRGRGASEIWTGYTRDYLPAGIAGAEDLAGRLIPCRVTGVSGDGTLLVERAAEIG